MLGVSLSAAVLARDRNSKVNSCTMIAALNTQSDVPSTGVIALNPRSTAPRAPG